MQKQVLVKEKTMAQCRLRVLSEQYRGKNFDLSKDKYTLGRVEQRDICITDPTISTYHCELIKNERTYILRDCGSTNGTRVNGFPINGQKELKSSDILLIGSVEILFDCEEKTIETSTSTQTQINFTKNHLERPVSKGMKNFSPFEFYKKKSEKTQKFIFTCGLISLLFVLLALLVYLGKITIFKGMF